MMKSDLPFDKFLILRKWVLQGLGEERGNCRPVIVITANSFCKVFVYCSCFSQLFLRQQEATRSESANKVMSAFYTIKLRTLWLEEQTVERCKENPIYVILFWELRGLSPNFHIHLSVSDLYIPRISHIFPAAE